MSRDGLLRAAVEVRQAVDAAQELLDAGEPAGARERLGEASIELADAIADARRARNGTAMNGSAPTPMPPAAFTAGEDLVAALVAAGALSLEAGKVTLARIRAAGVTSDSFDKERERLVFAAATALLDAGTPCDHHALVAELRRRGKLDDAGGDAYLRVLAALLVVPGQAEHLAVLVAAAGRRRDLERAALRAIELARAGRDADQIAAMLSNAVASTAAPRPTVPFPALDLGAFLERPPAPPDWDLHGYWARGDVVLVTGDPGVGKSLNAQAIAAKSAGGGGEHLGDQLAARRVLYLDLESPEDVVYDRLRAFGVHGNLDTFRYLWRPPGVDLTHDDGLARLRATIDDHRAEIAWIDSLRRAAPALDENDSRQVSTLFSSLRDIALELRCSIVIIHHPRKPVGDAKVEALYAARGSGDLPGSVDSYIFYRKLSGGLIRIEHGKARRGREHDHVLYRIVTTDDGEPAIERVELDHDDPETRDARAIAVLRDWVIPYVDAHPGNARTSVEAAYCDSTDGARGARGIARHAIDLGLTGIDDNGEHFSLAKGPGRAHNGTYLYPASQTSLPLAEPPTASNGEHTPDPSKAESSPRSPQPFRAASRTASTTPTGSEHPIDDEEIERVAAIACETEATA